MPLCAPTSLIPKINRGVVLARSNSIKLRTVYDDMMIQDYHGVRSIYSDRASSVADVMGYLLCIDW